MRHIKNRKTYSKLPVPIAVSSFITILNPKEGCGSFLRKNCDFFKNILFLSKKYHFLQKLSINLPFKYIFRQ